MAHANDTYTAQRLTKIERAFRGGKASWDEALGALSELMEAEVRAAFGRGLKAAKQPKRDEKERTTTAPANLPMPPVKP